MKIFVEWVFHFCGSWFDSEEMPNRGENDDPSLRGEFTRVVSVNIDDHVSVYLS